MDNNHQNTKTILLATFTSKRRLVDTVNLITRTYDIDRNRIFVLKDVNDESEDSDRYILSYNIIINERDKSIPHHKNIPNTIKTNRNKLNNCLYTINALNAIIYERTGSVDSSYEVNWSEFKNCFLTTDKEEGNDGKLVVCKTKLESIQTVRR